MEDVGDEEDAYDYDLSLETTAMDEDYFRDADETLVNDSIDISGDQDLGEFEADSPTVNGDDDHDYVNDPNTSHHSPSPEQDTPKATWSEDTVQTESMSRLGICINTAARVVVCLTCAAVIKPLELGSHLSKKHPPMSITPPFYQELVDTYQLREDPLRSRPGRIITAIYGLDLVEGYLSCNTCGYACKTEGRMKNHISNSQGCKHYRSRYAQAFRSRSNQMFFGVDLHKPDVTVHPLDPVAYLKAKFAPLPSNQVPITPPAPSDTHNFLNREHWHKHVAGKTGAEIQQVVREREPELRKEVRIVLERYAKNAVKKLDQLDNEAKGAIGDYLG